MTSHSARDRLRKTAAPYYEPRSLAASLLSSIEELEHTAGDPPPGPGRRSRMGLVCAPDFMGMSNRGQVEDAITGWIARRHDGAEPQVRDLYGGARPDLVYAFERDALGEDILVVVEAKPVWQRWIQHGSNYSGVTTDEGGRSTGNYCANNIGQVVRDRDKLLRRYDDPRDRHLLLALVFERPGEVDDRLVEAIGPDWRHCSRHIVDLCNPPGDDIGVTGMVFWPAAEEPAA